MDKWKNLEMKEIEQFKMIQWARTKAVIPYNHDVLAYFLFNLLSEAVCHSLHNDSTVNNPSLNRTLDNVIIVDVIFIYCFCARITRLKKCKQIKSWYKKHFPHSFVHQQLSAILKSIPQFIIYAVRHDKFVKIIQKNSLVVSFGAGYNSIFSQMREWKNF